MGRSGTGELCVVEYHDAGWEGPDATEWVSARWEESEERYGSSECIEDASGLDLCFESWFGLVVELMVLKVICITM